MERTVSGISGMIGEFAALIEAQSELVDGIDRFESEGRRAEGRRACFLCISSTSNGDDDDDDDGRMLTCVYEWLLILWALCEENDDVTMYVCIYVRVFRSVGKEATSRVKQTDAELQLTLERSQSHQLSMTALLLLLSFGLLLLDFLSP